MSFKLRLFLMFGCLIAALVAAQWMFVRAMTRDVYQGVGEVAVTVGQGMAGVMVFDELNREDAAVTERRKLRRQRLGTTTTDTWIKRDGSRASVSRPGGPDILFEIKDFDNEKVHQAQVWVEAYKEDASGIERESQTYSFAWRKEENEWRDGPPVRHVLGSGDHSVVLMLDQDPETANFLYLEKDGLRQQIPVPRENIDQAVSRTSTYLLGGSVLILLLGLAGGGYLAHRVADPLARLASAAKEVGGGALGHTVKDTQGPPEVVQAIHSFNTMSMRLRALDDIARRHEQRKNLSELGEIARGLAHTIRNPLNTLGLSVEQLAALSGDKTQSKVLVDSAQTQIRRIDQWIRSFLAMASEGKGQSEALDVGGLVQDVALEAIQDNGHRASLKVQVADDLPKIQGVAPELRAVIQALVVNAVEASPENGTVWVTAERAERTIRIEVIDQGPGIPLQVRERLFTPHVTTKTYGSGMGLFLAHRITNGRYRGQLMLEDIVPNGTRAVLILPEENEYEDQDLGG